MQTYLEGIQKLNQQRGMTGNQAFNKGMDASLAEGYFDSEYKNRRSQEQLQLQKDTLAMQQQGQAFNQATSMQNRQDQKEAQTNQLIGSAIGGVANLGMQAYGMRQRGDLMDRMYPQQVTQPNDITQPEYTGMGSINYDPQSTANNGFMDMSGQPQTEVSTLDNAWQNIKDIFTMPEWMNF